jgi:hypothetical protein
MGFLSGITDSLFGGSDDSGIKEQRKANEKSQAYIQQQTGLTRGEAGQLYQQGDYARNMGINLAMALMGQALPQQQRQLQMGQYDYQNAILGNQDGTNPNGQMFSYMQGVQPQASPMQLPNFQQTWNIPTTGQPGGAQPQATQPSPQVGSQEMAQLLARLLGGQY